MMWSIVPICFAEELVLRLVFDFERRPLRPRVSGVYCASTPLMYRRFRRSSTVSPGTPMTRFTYSVSSRGDGNVTTSPRCGSRPARDPDQRERNAQVVCQFVDDDAVADQDRRLHAAGRHLIPVGDRRAEHHHHGDEQNEAAPVAPDAGQALPGCVVVGVVSQRQTSGRGVSGAEYRITRTRGTRAARATTRADSGFARIAEPVARRQRKNLERLGCQQVDEVGDVLAPLRRQSARRRIAGSRDAARCAAATPRRRSARSRPASVRRR